MRVRIFSPSGSAVVKQHGYYVQDGKTLFGEVGEIDLSRKINEAGRGCTLYDMIQKYQKTGDDSFLYAKAQAYDADLTVAPKSLIDLYNLKSTAKEDFYKFPVDFRALFNHDIEQYFDAIQNKTIEEKMTSYFESKGKEIIKNEEAVADESIK